MTSYERFEKTTHGPWETAGLDVQFRVESEGNTVRVFFQCTKSLVDWIVDFLSFPVVHAFSKTMKLHAGYELAFSTAFNSIIAEIQKYQRFYDALKIEIHGYSYGGGIATLLHLYIKRCFQWHEVHTELYGSPRVVFGKLTESDARLFDGLVSFKVHGDIVTHYMPKLTGYKDVGEVRYIGNRSNGWKLSWRKHAPESYRNALLKLNRQ